MYRHCIFCKADFGGNEVIERFPVGRRLAFDAAHGRLWVVCRGCNRWNLTPIEERWEAIEECERLYRATPTRFATENIGLARVSEGTDLVRIGKPQRPEFAAWRYTSRLLQRYRRETAIGAAGLGASLLYGGTQILGVAGFWPAWAVYILATGASVYRQSFREVARIKVGSRDLRFVRSDVIKTELLRRHSGWSLRLKHHGEEYDIEGDGALKAAGVLLPHINYDGASTTKVQSAVRLIQEAPDAEAYFNRVARMPSKTSWSKQGSPDRIFSAHKEIRIALEMICHEDQERRALEGELHELETMWREAEEIAAISDNLLLPRSVKNLFRRHKENP